MNRHDAKVLLRNALVKNGWFRFHTTRDGGDNCYTETWRYNGSDTSLRGYNAAITWKKTYVQVSLPRKLARSRVFVDECVARNTNWRCYKVENDGDRRWYSVRGDQHFLEGLLVVEFKEGFVTFKADFPSV